MSPSIPPFVDALYVCSVPTFCLSLGVWCCGFQEESGSPEELMVHLGSQTCRADSCDIRTELKVGGGVRGELKGRLPLSSWAGAGEAACAKAEQGERIRAVKESFDSLAVCVALGLCQQC